MDQIRSNDPSMVILEGTSFVRCSSNRLGTVKTIKASLPCSSILEMPSLYPYLLAARWPTTWYANRKCRKYVLIIINHKTRQHYTWAHLHAWYYLFQRLNRQITNMKPTPQQSPPSRAPLIIIIIIYLLTQLIVTSPFAQQRMTVSAFHTVLLRKGRPAGKRHNFRAISQLIALIPFRLAVRSSRILACASEYDCQLNYNRPVRAHYPWF